jgi:glycosyltransferase involved in cell wall biosynthesis
VEPNATRNLIAFPVVWCPTQGQEGLTRTKIERDHPWALDGTSALEFWGCRTEDADGSYVCHGPRIPATTPLPIATALSWLFQLWRGISTNGPVSISASSPWSALGAAAARVFNGRLYLAVRIQGRTATRAALLDRSSLREAIVTAVERFSVRRADLVVPMGRYTEDLARSFGADPGRILMLPFPLSWGEAGSSKAGTLRKNPRLIGCATRLIPGKGVEVLLRAFPPLLGEFPDLRLEIAGHGPLGEALAALAQRLGLSQHVTWRGWVPAESVRELFGRASIAVLSSTFEEGRGLVLTEAGLMNCALVGSDLGGIPDMIVNGKTGALVPPSDHVALAGAIGSLLRDHESREGMGRAARALALEYVRARPASLSTFRERIVAGAAAR